MAATAFVRQLFDDESYFGARIAFIAATIGTVALAAILAVGTMFFVQNMYRDMPVAEPHAGHSVMVATPDGLGSGTHIGNGYYLTARHVVHGSDKIKIGTDTGEKHDARVMWESEDYDIALIVVDKPLKNEDAATLSCRPLKPAQLVHFEGNPEGFKSIRTYGHVGTMTPNGAEQWSRLTPEPITTWKEALVVDAVIIPGMSGGGAFDEAGHLVGVNVGVIIYNGAPTGLGIIVPSSTICKLLART
jgi:S1-C subfamily serine protease